MKLAWWWNRNYEDLMGVVGNWVKEQSSIKIAHVDCKFTELDAHGNRLFYFMIFYTPGA